VAQQGTGWYDENCSTTKKYLCEKLPQCLTPTFTAIGCDWITPAGNKIELKPDKVRHIQNSPCQLFVTRSVGTDSFPTETLSYTATADCPAKTWRAINEGEKA